MAGAQEIRLPDNHPPGPGDLSNFHKAPGNMVLENMNVYLAMPNKAEFQNRLVDQANPSSPNYGKSVSQEELKQRYAPLESDFIAVLHWLVPCGFTVTRTDTKAGYGIRFNGTVAITESVFDTTIVTNGTGIYANAIDPVIPLRFKRIVSVVELDNYLKESPESHNSE